MKKIYSRFINLMLILFFTHGISQPYDSLIPVDLTINGYKKTYHTPKLNKEHIHSYLAEWLALNHESYNDEILLNIKEKIITKGNFSLNLNYPLYEFLKGWYDKKVDIVINYTLIISIREGEYEVELSLPKKVKVTQVYGPNIYTEINENDLCNNYKNPTVNRDIVEADFLKQMKCECKDRYKIKINSSCKDCEELKNEKREQCFKRYSTRLFNKTREQEKIDKILGFKKDFACSLNERVRKLFYDNLTMKSIKANRLKK